MASYIETGKVWEANLRDSFQIGSRAQETTAADVKDLNESFKFPPETINARSVVSVFENTEDAINYDSDLAFVVPFSLPIWAGVAAAVSVAFVGFALVRRRKVLDKLATRIENPPTTV